MDQSKVNPFVGNTETSAGGSPVSVSPADPAANTSTAASTTSAGSAASTTPANSTQPSYPVNPYAPAGAPYAPGSNTPAPDYYDSSNNTYTYSDGPAVPNTGFSSYPSQEQDIYIPSDTPEKPKLFTKKFIIIASIGIFLIAAAVVAGLLVQNNKKPKTTSSEVVGSNSYQKALNMYINYIVSGSDSSEHEGFTYNENTNYFLTSKLYNCVTDASTREDAKIVITNTKKYFEEYYSQVPDNKKETISESGISVGLYGGIVNLIDYIINNQPSNAEASPTQFIQGLEGLDLGPATVYASLYSGYIESGKSDEATKDLDNFINSYAAYLLYNSPGLDIQAREGIVNE